jgi:hypothetical protein
LSVAPQGLADGRFIGYFSIEGEGQYTYRGIGNSPASGMGWAPHSLAQVNGESCAAAAANEATCESGACAFDAAGNPATCTGTDSTDQSDCALSATWAGGDQSASTCATANGCSFAAATATCSLDPPVRGIDNSHVADSCATATVTWPADATCSGTDSTDGTDCALNPIWSGGEKTEATCATSSGCGYTFSGCITTATTACCAENIRNYYDTDVTTAGEAGTFRRWRSYDARLRPWYLQQEARFDAAFPTGISTSESTGWSSVYQMITSMQLGITAMGVLTLSDQSFGGVWGVDFLLDDIENLLSTTISGRQPGYGCFIFIVERGGDSAGKLIGSIERSPEGVISAEPMLNSDGVRPSAVNSNFPANANAAGLLQAAGWPSVTSLLMTTNSVHYEVSTAIFVDRSIDWLLVSGQDTACPTTHIWRSDEGVCTQCEPGKRPQGSSCVNCPARHAGADGSCALCAESHIPNELQTTCEACPPMHVPDPMGLGCVACGSGQVPSADGTVCVCMEGRYDRSNGLIFCFDLGFEDDPVRAASDAFPQKCRVELSAGNPCLPCPDCVDCNSSGGTPVPAAGWGLSPTAEKIWTNGLNSNTSHFVRDPSQLEPFLLENPSASKGFADREIEEWRSLHAEHVPEGQPWSSSFEAYEKDCVSRVAASAAVCSETFSGEDELNGFCDFDPATQMCRPAIHRFALNRSLFRCPDLGDDKSACNEPSARAENRSDGQLSRQCIPLHTGTLCSRCEPGHSGFFVPDVHGGMDAQCKPCEQGGTKFAVTLVVLGLLLLGVVWIFRYLEKKSAKLDELRVHYTILSKVQQAASTLRGDASVDEEKSRISLQDTVRVIFGNLQIIATLPVVFEAKFVSHLTWAQWIFDLRKYFQLDFFGLMSVDCLIRVTLYTRFTLTLAIPTFLIVFIQVRAKVQQCRQRRRALKAPGDLGGTVSLFGLLAAKNAAAHMKSRLSASKINAASALSFAVIFFFYPICSSTIFQMLDCRPMDIGQSWHTYDMGIDCHSTTYRRVRIVAWVLIAVIPVGIPAFFGVILYWNRSRLSADNSDDINYEVFARICRSLHRKKSS